MFVSVTLKGGNMYKLEEMIAAILAFLLLVLVFVTIAKFVIALFSIKFWLCVILLLLILKILED